MNWNLIKNHILHDPFMKFNLNMKVKQEKILSFFIVFYIFYKFIHCNLFYFRTDQELLERSNYLINCIKQEKSKKKNNKNGKNNNKNESLTNEKKEDKKISSRKKKKMKKKKTK